MSKTNHYSDYITPIPDELKTEKMVKLYEYLYELQIKNRPQDFKMFKIIQGVTDERINRLGFILHDNYTLKPLTNEKGSANIFFSTNNNCDKLILKYDYISENKIKNPFENEFKTLIHHMNKMSYKGIEFKKDEDFNVFFYKNHKVRAEMIELREYLKENNFEFLRMCGTNISPGQFDIFDYGLFIDYKTKDKSYFNNNEQEGRLYGYDIPEDLKNKLKQIPFSVVRSDLLIVPNPQESDILDIFDTHCASQSNNKDYQDKTFYTIL
jgi:hypothetical protein